MRNQHNNREYNLFRTEAGWRVFNDHHKFEQACYARTFQKLEIFTDEELELYCRVQQRLNEAFRLDAEDSYQLAKRNKQGLFCRTRTKCAGSICFIANCKQYIIGLILKRLNN